MSKTWLVGVSALLLVTGPGLARATDIAAQKISIKDNANPVKRQIQAQSKDPAVLFGDADDPGTNGAAIHVYSATDDFCEILEPGANWKMNGAGTLWKYSNKTTKNAAQVKNGKLAVKIKSGVTYTLADNGTQGTVNVEVQFGTGTRYCMQCSNATKDTAKKFLAKACAATACAPEPSTCNPGGATTTTTTSSTTTTTAGCAAPTGTVVKGSLTATPGRFNYNATLGLPGANAACNTNFPGSHACMISELQAAPASDLACLKDTANMTVTSFWAIDNNAAALQQCNDDALNGSGLNWEYGTAHTVSRGERAPLNNNTGALGAVQTSIQCNIAGTSWVACCQ